VLIGEGGNIWREGIDQFHSPTKTRTCVLQNIIPLGSDRLVSQIIFFILLMEGALSGYHCPVRPIQVKS